MEQNGRMESINRIFVWFTNLAYLNLLWVLFTLLGLVVLGVAPSTSALFAVIRQLLISEEKVPITRLFISYYRKDFWKVNGIFFIFVLIGAILFVDLYFLYQVKNTFSTLLLYLMIIFTFIYLITSIFIFPVFAHYDLTLFGYLKQAFLIGMMKPLYVLFILISLAISYLMLIYLKTLLIFFGISLGAFIIMSTSIHIFKNLKRVEVK